MALRKNIAVIGARGSMGGALVRGILKRKIVPKECILGIVRREDQEVQLKKKHRICVSHIVADANDADVIIVVVKQADLPQVLAELKAGLRPKTLVVSMVAGTKLEEISGQLGGHRNVVRCMPNTPASICMGITGWTAKGLDADALACIRTILCAVGEEIYFEDEAKLDPVTAVSGTGPAGGLYLFQAMIDGGVREGLSYEVARKLVLHTMRGTAEMALRSDLHLAELRRKVTSPGGTTCEAILQMEEGGIAATIVKAIRAACEHCRELGRKK